MIDALADFYRSVSGWKLVVLHGVNSGGVCNCTAAVNCGSPGKHPIAPWRGQDPTTFQARQNIGIQTGEISGIVVVDVDPRNGGDRWLNHMLAVDPESFNTPTVETGGGGKHYYYQYDGDNPSCGIIAAGVDYKANGGYVVAPPSITAGKYTWLRNPRDTPTRKTPTWLNVTRKNGNQQTPDGPILPGNRNEYLFRAGSCMRRYGIKPDDIYTAISTMNNRCSPPLPESEIQSIITSISRYSPEEVHAWPTTHMKERTMIRFISAGGTEPHILFSLHMDAGTVKLTADELLSWDIVKSKILRATRLLPDIRQPQQTEQETWEYNILPYLLESTGCKG